MQQDPTAYSTQQFQPGSRATTSPDHDNGLLSRDASARGSGGKLASDAGTPRSRSRGSANADGSRTPSVARDLSDEDQPVKQRLGQRITDYERALSRASHMPQQPLGFRIVKRADGPADPDGAQLMDLPNEVLTRIVTQLRPDARIAASMVCKRLREVVMTPYAWQLAFVQHFPGVSAPQPKEAKQEGVWKGASDVQMSYEQPSSFARITPQATWRSEFLLRSELMQGLSLGKPGIGKESGPGYYYKKARKAQGTLIYFPRRSPTILTNLHVLYGKDTASRAIHGSRQGGFASISDPSTGRVDRWGDEDDWDHLLMPNLSDEELHDMEGRGILHVHNTLDVSAAYGRVGGLGLPGGRAFFLGTHNNTQRVSNRLTKYLEGGYMHNDERPDLPDVFDIGDAISCVWLAKSSEVPATTRSMVGILTGTTTGVVTAYALASEGSPNKLVVNGCISARWVLSPGVPIVAFQIDEQYSVRRRRQGRVWAVALNALGEVFYLDAPPRESLQNCSDKPQAQLTVNAWEAGRSAPWQLLENTRRSRKDGVEVQDHELRFGQSVAQISTLSPEDLRHAAEEVNRLCRLPFWHFRETYAGWDMQRRLEVDFSSDDGSGAGESIFVMDSGAAGSGPAKVQRFTRSILNQLANTPPVLAQTASSARSGASIFGRIPSELTMSPSSSGTSSPMPKDMVRANGLPHTWTVEDMGLAGHQVEQITASTLDNSNTSVMTFSEDPLLNDVRQDTTDEARSPLRAIPGGRARNLVVGTSAGAVLVWNSRAQASQGQAVQPLRVIQTTSKEITAVAATALYIVHGGSDGLAQAWDPLASTLEPLHTIHSKNSIQPTRHTHPGGRRLTREDMNTVRAISVDPNPLLLRGCLTCGPGIHSWSFRSQDNVVKRKRRMRNIHGRPTNHRTGTEIVDYIAGEEAEVRREQKERAAEFERLHRNFGLGELTEEEAIVYAQMLSQEAAEEERLRDQQLLLLQSESDAELARLSRRLSNDDQISDDTASVDTGYLTSSDVTSSHDPLDQGLISQSPHSSYIVSISDDRGFNGMYSPGGERSTDYPIMVKAKQGKQRRGKKNTRQGSSSASSASGEAAGSSAAASAYPRYGHNATASTGSEGDFSISGLSADEQLALALRLSAVQEEGENMVRSGSAVNADENEFPTLISRDLPGKGKGKSATAVPASWGESLATPSGLTEDEELALALEASMHNQ